jgi:hypothetical protein
VKIKAFILFLIFGFLVLLLVVKWNQNQLKLSSIEIELLMNRFGDLKINDTADIIRIQNIVINEIKHEFNQTQNLSIKDLLTESRGYCYDRSLLLQKILVLNKIKIRPIYIYYHLDSSPVKYIDFFDPNISSHNIFEFKWEDKWYIIRTNSKQVNIETIDNYLKNSNSVPTNSKYIRHLNNRHGKFIYPSWIPDIY